MVFQGFEPANDTLEACGMGKSRHFWAGAVALSSVMGTLSTPTEAAGLVSDGPTSHWVHVESNENFLLSVYSARTQEKASAARAAWLAAGHSVSDAATMTPPAILAGRVVPQTLNVGDPLAFPTIRFNFKTGASGLYAVDFVFLSPTGQVAYEAGWGQGSLSYTTAGAIKFSNWSAPIALWSQPGTWTLSTVIVMDNAGNTTTYDAKAIAKLFTNTVYTVSNTTGFISSDAPKIVYGKLADHVSLSQAYPLLKGEIGASAPKTGLMLGYVLFQQPGADYEQYEDVPRPMPLSHGPLNIDTVFAASAPTGTYLVKGFAVCDYAGNCAGSQKDADVRALFGIDKFTVTP